MTSFPGIAVEKVVAISYNFFTIQCLYLPSISMINVTVTVVVFLLCHLNLPLLSDRSNFVMIELVYNVLKFRTEKRFDKLSSRGTWGVD